MRCHAAEPGAVTSTVSGLTSPPYSWRTGRSVGGPRGSLPGRREARLYGPDGRASVIPRLDQGARAPVRLGRTARYWQNTAVERRLASGPIARAAGSPSHGEHVARCAIRRSAPSLCLETEKRHEGAPRHRLSGMAERWLTNIRPHPEERRTATRLEGRGRPHGSRRRATRGPHHEGRES